MIHIKHFIPFFLKLINVHITYVRACANLVLVYLQRNSTGP